MARNYKELQAKMDPASLADNQRRVREELQRMALEELRGGTVVIDRFGEYKERPYVVDAMAEGGGIFRLRARPLQHQGAVFSTKKFKVSRLTKALRALHLPDAQIASIRASKEKSNGRIEIGGSGPSIERVFSIPHLVAAGFDETCGE
jgi:hypothetical protein